MATKSTNYQQEIPESGDYVDIDVVGRTIAFIDTQVSKNAKTASDASTTLTKNLGIETDRAKKAEQALSSSISDEVTRAKGAEAANKKLITDETTRAKGVEGTLASLTTEVKTDLVSAINSEATRAKASEQENATAISIEATRAKGAEGTLTTNLSTEVNRAKGAEKTLTDNLATETSRAIGAENTLTTNLNSEISRAKGVEGTRAAGTYIKATNTLAQNDTALDTQVKKNTDAIEVLNGTGAGSVTKTVSDAVANVVADAPENFDTLKKISDQISTHTDSTTNSNLSNIVSYSEEEIATIFIPNPALATGEVTVNWIHRCGNIVSMHIDIFLKEASINNSDITSPSVNDLDYFVDLGNFNKLKPISRFMCIPLVSRGALKNTHYLPYGYLEISTSSVSHETSLGGVIRWFPTTSTSADNVGYGAEITYFTNDITV